MTERLHFSLLYVGEGNGNPLQCSCLENSKDGGAWWAAVYGVAQSWTRLKRLSSSSVLVRLGCYNKIQQTEWLMNNRNLFFIVLEAKVTIRVPAWLSEGPLQGCRLLAIFSHDRRGGGDL